ncbi:MAG: hypothetical protein ACXV2C_04655 [Candidatus Bathyarchaeia archaeon]
MLKLKALNVPVSAATVRVKVAGITSFGEIGIPSLSQLRDNTELADVGFQLVGVIVSVSVALPAF